MVTIKDIAKRSGFSVTTVSKALNDYPDISKKTKKKILDLCERMGYVPNLSARSLVSKKTYTIGVVFEEITGLGLQHPLFSQILESFKNEVEKEGYDILFLSKNIIEKKDSYLQHSKRKQVEAVLVLCAQYDSKMMTDIYKCDTPSIVIDFVSEDSLTVTSNDYVGIEKAIKHLQQNGHKKIAHITGGKHTFVGGQRVEHFNTLIKDYSLITKEEYIIEGPTFTKEEGYGAMKKLLELEDKPTAIFCSSDMLAIGAIKAIEEHNMSVPEDFSIIGFDGITLGQLISPRLTTVKQDTKMMGEIAGRNIIQMIKNNKKQHIGETIEIDCDLTIGESTRAI